MLKTFAEDLKAIRIEKNISLKTISQQTRLNVSILENLESGDYTFQPQAYIRAFLKQYINGLGLDVEETLFDYDLARSGKYKSNKQESLQKQTETSEKETIIKAPEDKKAPVEKLKEKIDPPKKIAEKEKTEKVTTPVKEPDYIPDTKKTAAEKSIKSKVPLRKEAEPKSLTEPRSSKNKISFSFLSSPVFRNITFVLFILLVLIGIYSLVNILFFEKSDDKPEVIRQNFDEVVMEQERKLLGKRTPEEIQDSIRKANEELLAVDSITLRVTAIGSGVFYIVTDSIRYSRPERVAYEKDESGIFKAKKMFHISSNNTESFRATLNNIPLKFDKTVVSKVKINKTGIVK